MSQAAAAIPRRSGRSWRAIRQEVKPRAMSSRGRRRRTLGVVKIVVLCALIAAAAWALRELAGFWAGDRGALARALNSPPVGQPVLITNGVLTQAWLRGALAIPPSARLMSLDLEALRDRLQANGQVRVAVLTRSFPSTLVVTIQERFPVARIQVKDGDGSARQLLVAPDGVVYDGFNYDASMIAGLPWLGGFKLRRSGDDYEPIAGMEAVASLLTTAQTEANWLYRTWRAVFLDRLDPHHELVVHAGESGEVVFSTDRDYYKQIAELDLILDRVRNRTDARIRSINVALGNQVPVEFELSPVEMGLEPSQNFKVQPVKRTTARDL